MAKRKKAAAPKPQASQSAPFIEISPAEQERLVDISGVLKRPTGPTLVDRIDSEEDGGFADEVFNTILFVIPFTFLFAMMDM